MLIKWRQFNSKAVLILIKETIYTANQMIHIFIKVLSHDNRPMSKNKMVHMDIGHFIIKFTILFVYLQHEQILVYRYVDSPSRSPVQMLLHF